MVAVGVLISINSLSNNPFKPKGKADDLPILTVDHWEFIWVDLPVTVDVLQTWLKQQQQQTAPKSNRQSGQWTADLAHAFFFFSPIPISEVSQEGYADGELPLGDANCLHEDI